MFINREDAGHQLARLLTSYASKPGASQPGASQEETCVVGLPRGGVITAAVVARDLHLPLDVICPRKIASPMQPEYALGAVAEHGEALFDNRVLRHLRITPSDLAEETEHARIESRRRAGLYRASFPHPTLKDKTVIVVDDGIATGLTMAAALSSLRKEGASTLIVAVPVLPADRVAMIKTMANGLYYVQAPQFFQAVGEFYQDFRNVEDEEVLHILAAHSKAAT